MKIRVYLWYAAAAAAAAAGGLPAKPVQAADAAKTYPDRPIRMIMPNAPGSSIDTMGRIVASKLGEALGQQIVIDNRAGAGGTIGMEIGKNATPDGYTIIGSSTAAMSIAPHIYKNLPYDPLKDFEFITNYAITANMLVVNPALPAKTIKEFIELAKARGKALNMASAGPGSQSHLAGAAFLMAAHIESTHVPYKGGGPSVAAVVAGESQWTLTPAPAVMGLVRNGRLRALGHTLPQRASIYGDIPAIAETVAFQYNAQAGLLAPKGTPRPMMDKLRSVLAQVERTPEFKSLFEAQGAVPDITTSEEFRRLTAEQTAITGRIVRAAGLKVE